MSAAKRQAFERAALIQKEAELPVTITPPGYGSIVRPH